MTSKKKQPTTPAPAQTDQPVFSLISNQKLQQLYGAMLKCRLLKREIGEEMSRYAFIPEIVPGLEAAAAGVAIDLVPDDTVTASGWDVAVQLLTGTALGTILTALDACEESPDCWPARLNGALGAALTNKTKENNKIVVVFFSRVFDTPSTWAPCRIEAMKVAAGNDLPMVFVCHSEFVMEPADQKPAKKVSKKHVQATALDGYEFGLPVIPVDGDDAVAVYRVASESIARARGGRGPTLIECSRSADGDSIANMETYLTRKGLFREEVTAEIAAEFGKDLAALKPVAKGMA